MPTADKADKIEHLVAELSESQLVVLTDYRGLSVAEIGQLRRQLRDAETVLEVAKNTLIKRASDEVGIGEGLSPLLQGPTAVAFARRSDISQVAKALTDYARTAKTFSVKGGILQKHVLSAGQIEQLAGLPSRDVLLARVMGGMQAPITGMVTVLSGTLRGFVNVLQARKDQLAEQQGG
ncbi:MAG: 50S ribosomal protein L10 [Chloroflexota bacterium]